MNSRTSTTKIVTYYVDGVHVRENNFDNAPSVLNIRLDLEAFKESLAKYAATGQNIFYLALIKRKTPGEIYGETHTCKIKFRVNPNDSSR